MLIRLSTFVDKIVDNFLSYVFIHCLCINIHFVKIGVKVLIHLSTFYAQFYPQVFWGLYTAEIYLLSLYFPKGLKNLSTYPQTLLLILLYLFYYSNHIIGALRPIFPHGWIECIIRSRVKKSLLCFLIFAAKISFYTKKRIFSFPFLSANFLTVYAVPPTLRTQYANNISARSII